MDAPMSNFLKRVLDEQRGKCILRSRELTESCVNKARLQATGSPNFAPAPAKHCGSGIDFAIEGDLPEPMGF